MGLRTMLGIKKRWVLQQKHSPYHFKASELERMKKFEAGCYGTIELYGNPFQFHEGHCYYDSYKEIIKDRIYEFETKNLKPYIIDCGANMGLSVLYFARKYPTATIMAFEPEAPIYDVLEKNIATYQLRHVTAVKKAVWNTETTLRFYTDSGMGGSVENVFSTQEPKLIETVRLKDYINRQVDFLKLDIEGAEYTVLQDCTDVLHHVQNLFVEYHSFINKEQHLDDLLALLKQAGFRYHLRQSFSRSHPFVDDLLACENMDMAINIFAYRHNR